MTEGDQLAALERLAKLKETGMLTEEEFAARKLAILSQTTTDPVRFYRRLWFVVLLTCLLVTFPVAMIILFTGDVFRKKSGQIVPIGKTPRLVYASLLAVWLVALIAKNIADPNYLKEQWAQSAATDSSSTAASDANAPDACDSSDVADMVKRAIENGASSKLIATRVIDFGHAHEMFFDKKANARYCGADGELNSGSTKLSYKLYFGPSGGELVEVQEGEDAYDTRSMIASAASQSETANTQATVAAADSSQTFAGGRYHRNSPASADMTITRHGDLWRITLNGAAPPNGAASPADCSLVAEGPAVNGRIYGRLVPFHNDNMEISEDDLKANPGKLIVQIATPGVVTVSDASVEPYCGAGSDLTGSYSPVR